MTASFIFRGNIYALNRACSTSNKNSSTFRGEKYAQTPRMSFMFNLDLFKGSAKHSLFSKYILMFLFLVVI